MRNGSLPWKPELTTKGHELAEAFASYDPGQVVTAVQEELAQRMGLFAAGVRQYHHAAREPVTNGSIIQILGTTRLLDYGKTSTQDAPPLLIIPSLVNRYTVLDLDEDNSFIRQLEAQGFHPYVVDWDAPGPEEKSFDLNAYITQRLKPLLVHVSQLHNNRPIGVLGYCMGGLLATALANRHPDLTASLVLLATPWDFHVEHEAQVRMLETMMPQFEALLGVLGEMPVDVLQAMFVSLDPWLTMEKFQRFARMSPDAPSAHSFVALEDWLNDGVPLAGPTAIDCLRGWYIENRPKKGQWIIEGKPVLPDQMDIPSLSIIPGRDHIVPPDSAQALADALPHSEAITLDAGHIGMVVGRRSKTLLIDPLVAWLKKNQP